MAGIQIEALETFMDGRQRFAEGDRVTVSAEDAKRFCGAGWAKAVKGEIPTGERKVIRAVLTPHGSASKQTVGEAG